MRNFARINNYYNRIEAQKDWIRLADQCDADLVKKHEPSESAGWRKIDKCISALRSAQQEREASDECNTISAA